MSQIYVVGHRNPDNDTIMAAYTYAHLKNLLDPDNEYVPARLGPLPAESEMLFQSYSLDGIPELIESLGADDKVILVDHNETAQAVEGYDEAEIVEIIDHHRIADISTAGPIFFLNMPLGSTASIITKLYEAEGIELEQGIAACLLSAVLTDTVILKSPTTTDEDKEIVDRLSKHIGVDPVEFGMRIFKSRGGDDEVSTSDICLRDSKEFNFGGRKVWIAQYETVDLEGMKSRIPEISAEVASIQTDKGYDAALLLLTDIIVEGSQFIAAGDLSIIEDAFDITFDGDEGVWMPGILSRKKQVAARLIECAG
ncbi:MAG: manganese-dependent inorganic pyrophosphatase [Coriobacteriaceae bacterium]|nr:manganese-dependent inorganic pyrophosphatase [Coriobacteriaceae bacterium]